jgi:hypothetical protein
VIEANGTAVGFVARRGVAKVVAKVVADTEPVLGTDPEAPEEVTDPEMDDGAPELELGVPTLEET